MNRLQTPPVLRDLIKRKNRVELPVKANTIVKCVHTFHNKMLARIKNDLKRAL